MSFKSQDFNKHSFDVSVDEKNFQLQQDVSNYKEYAKLQRDIDEVAPSTRAYRSFAILPDIVCIDILTKYGLDVHSQLFMNDPSNLIRLKRIIESEYPMLKTSNIRAL